MSPRLPLLVATAMLCSSGALAQSNVQVGLGNITPLPGTIATGTAGVLSGTATITQTTPGPGGTSVAIGPAGFQDGGLQNQPGSAALSVAEGCTIPSPIFNLFANIQFGTTTANPNPLPLTSHNGC
jgi:hypothetical protein